MTEIQQNRYDQLMRRVGGLIGAHSMVNDSLNELFPVLDVERAPIELRFLSGWQVGLGAMEVIAVPARFSHIQLFNPVDSNKLVVPTSFFISSSFEVTLRFALNNVDLGGVVANQGQRDTRVGVVERTTAQLTGTDLPGSVASFGLINIPITETYHLRDDDGVCVLGPGTGIEFSTSFAAKNLRVTAMWRERVAEASELSFGG